MVGLCRPYIGIKLVSLDKVVHFFTDPPLLAENRSKKPGPYTVMAPAYNAYACER